MAKNILLTFLSTVGIKNKDTNKEIDKENGRNNTIRIKAKYDLEDGGSPVETHITNESAVRYLAAHLPAEEKIDKIFVFLTDDVKKNQLLCEEAFLGEPDKEYATHFEYFKKRLSIFLPEYSEELIETQGYTGDDWLDYLDDIVKMAEKIQDYADGEEVCLSVDLTGGFRNANMIVLSIAKILQYSGISIDKILYSNMSIKGEIKKVEISNGIYELFDLVSGAEEFVRFGSVDSIVDYFDNKNEVNVELKNLLKAMKHFAQQIRLCHYGALKKAISDLSDKVGAFESYLKTHDKDVYATLFARLLSRIHKEYDAILQADFNNVAKSDVILIKWCLEKDYLQQVLTLYTERVPEIIVAGGIVSMTDTYVSDKGEARKNIPTSVAYELFVENTDAEVGKKHNSLINICQKGVLQQIKAICNRKLSCDRYSNDDIKNELNKPFQKKDKDGILLQEELFISNEEKLIEQLMQYDNMRYMLGNGGQLMDCKASFWIDAYREAEKRAIAKKDTKWAMWDEENDEKAKYNKRLRPYFGNNIASDVLKKMLDVRVLPLSKIIRKIRVGQLIHPQEIDLNCIAEIDMEYRKIRTERVISNHAKAEVSPMDYKDLKEALSNGITHIEEALEKIKC